MLVAWGMHERVVQTAPPPSMQCVGWTVYLNSLLGIESTVPEFEPNNLGLLDDRPSSEFLRSAAIEVSHRFGDRRSSVSEVYVVPFQEAGLRTRGFPFASAIPFSVVFVGFRDGGSEEIKVSDKGKSPFRVFGFIGNTLVYAALLACLGICAQKWATGSRKLSDNKSLGFPVIQILSNNDEISKSGKQKSCGA